MSDFTLPIGGMVRGNRTMTVFSNFPYRGLVDLIVKRWEQSGYATDFNAGHYLTHTTVKEFGSDA